MYTIISLQDNFEQVVDFIKFRDSYYNFFIEGISEGIKPEYFNLVLQAQDGFRYEQLEKLDYLNCSSPIPIFSQKFVEKIGKKIEDELIFFPCEILFKNRKYNFFVGRIKKYLVLLNEESSGKRLLSDGSSIISSPYKYNNVDNEFMIARDIKWKGTFLISERMKNEIVRNELNIGFEKVKLVGF